MFQGLNLVSVHRGVSNSLGQTQARNSKLGNSDYNKTLTSSEFNPISLNSPHHKLCQGEV